MKRGDETMSKPTIFELQKSADQHLKRAINLRDWEEVEIAEWEIGKIVEALSKDSNINQFMKEG
jgi:hypothetical protein